MHLKLKLLSGRGAVVHRMELGERCSSYAQLLETVCALTTEPLELFYVDSEQDVCKVTTDDELKASFEARALNHGVATFIAAPPGTPAGAVRAVAVTAATETGAGELFFPAQRTRATRRTPAATGKHCLSMLAARAAAAR